MDVTELIEDGINAIGGLAYSAVAFFLIFLALIVGLLFLQFFADAGLGIIENALNMALGFIP